MEAVSMGKTITSSIRPWAMVSFSNKQQTYFLYFDVATGLCFETP